MSKPRRSAAPLARKATGVLAPALLVNALPGASALVLAGAARRTRTAALACCLATCACGEANPSPPDGSPLLVDHGLWQLVQDPAADPFAERGRPTVHSCESGSYFEAIPGWFELELARCRDRYASVHQPSLNQVQAGDTIEFTFAHLLLRPVTLDTTEAYVALAINQTVVWERVIPIQVAARTYEEQFTLPMDAPAGSDVVFHIDNHGENSYDVGPLKINSAVPAD